MVKILYTCLLGLFSLPEKVTKSCSSAIQNPEAYGTKQQTSHSQECQISKSSLSHKLLFYFIFCRFCKKFANCTFPPSGLSVYFQARLQFAIDVICQVKTIFFINCASHHSLHLYAFNYVRVNILFFIVLCDIKAYI
jgi:hypothetical protein